MPAFSQTCLADISSQSLICVLSLLTVSKLLPQITHTRASGKRTTITSFLPKVHTARREMWRKAVTTVLASYVGVMCETGEHSIRLKTQ